ncbi:MAG: hypothetical protein A2571_00590 [Candidatus Vogelbacteria bacterium RIFOXYD1_FULL_44_32]|uniref:Uncharacterized protein n=1 Tax=Candidatus Vogelbacteria bacterium RIFOXYD1_FULL_44_32 TaxID=1802438 RepID=A0A1G2QE56_9BACT|nr:MAG: hypothetical protein A2571_00590 [Candidatus Vogelbacteria bacterium RIFOXYD1_FULL_44_32]
MEENDIAKKREAAKLAMSAGRQPLNGFSGGPTITPASSLETENKIIDAENEINQKREEARKAMEGIERRKKREDEEKINLQSAARAQEIELIKKKRILIEQKLEQEKIAAQKTAQTNEAKEEETYREKVAESKVEIDRLKNDLEHITPFHSLNTDITDSHDEKIISQTALAIAEREQKLNKEQHIQKKATKNVILQGLAWVVAFVFVGSSLGVLYYVSNLNKKQQAGVDLNIHKSIIFVEQEKEIRIDGKTPSQIKATMVATGQTVAEHDSLTDIYFSRTKKVEEKVVSENLGAGDFLAVTNAAFSPDFTHFLNQEFVAGVYTKTLSEQSYIYLFKTRSFEHALDTLLQDDKNMTIALYDGLINEPTKKAIAMSTFKDEMINNIDSHVLRDAEGKIIMLYAFFDRTTLIFAQNEAAMQKVLTALARPTTSTK